jgi:hypothetical protein
MLKDLDVVDYLKLCVAMRVARGMSVQLYEEAGEPFGYMLISSDGNNRQKKQCMRTGNRNGERPAGCSRLDDLMRSRIDFKLNR